MEGRPTFTVAPPSSNGYLTMGRTKENATTLRVAGVIVGPSLAVLSAVFFFWAPDPWVCLIPAVLAIMSTLWYRRRTLSRSAIPNTVSLIAFGVALIVILMRAPAVLAILTRS